MVQKFFYAKQLSLFSFFFLLSNHKLFFYFLEETFTQNSYFLVKCIMNKFNKA